jgi:hypothetical protein
MASSSVSHSSSLASSTTAFKTKKTSQPTVIALTVAMAVILQNAAKLLRMTLLGLAHLNRRALLLGRRDRFEREQAALKSLILNFRMGSTGITFCFGGGRSRVLLFDYGIDDHRQIRLLLVRSTIVKICLTDGAMHLLLIKASCCSSAAWPHHSTATGVAFDRAWAFRTL